MNRRTSIPEKVKQELRRQSGFGCCRCGMPIIEYHHIIPVSIEDHNRAEDMMTLCPTCHDMCTKNALTEQQQREYKKNPYNIQKGYVDGQLIVNQNYCVIALGTNLFFGESIPFSVNGIPLISMKIRDKRLNISVKLFDKQDSLLAEVTDNEWVSGNPAVWDLWASYQRLRIRTKAGDISLDIDATSNPMKIKGKLRKESKVIKISPKGISSSRPGGGLNMNNTAAVNISFNFDTKENRINFTGGKLNRGPSREDLMAWGIAEMRQS